MLLIKLRKFASQKNKEAVECICSERRLLFWTLLILILPTAKSVGQNGFGRFRASAHFVFYFPVSFGMRAPQRFDDGWAGRVQVFLAAVYHRF
jgi:hypothetical protein